MRSGAAAGYAGFFHEAAFYRTDEELQTIVVPFLVEGTAQGEPTVAALSDRNAALVRAALGDGSGVFFARPVTGRALPAANIRAYRRLCADRVAAGAAQIRVVGEVPHPGLGAMWDGWARCEAIANDALDDYPLWGLCVYDLRIAPEEVLADVRCTHRFLRTGDGGHDRNVHYNAHYIEPAEFLRRRPGAAADPLETSVPAVRMLDPAPPVIRPAVQHLGRECRLDQAEIDGLVFGVIQAVAAAARRGRGPVRVHGWAGTDRAVVTVHEHGPGPDDPFVGLVPTRDSDGRGLWLAHQLCAAVTCGRDGTGFTVRLIAGRPHV